MHPSFWEQVQDYNSPQNITSVFCIDHLQTLSFITSICMADFPFDRFCMSCLCVVPFICQAFVSLTKKKRNKIKLSAIKFELVKFK